MFENNRLPTLDYELWMQENNTIAHSYYEKPMKTQIQLEKTSAMESRQKYCISSNELTRRLYNVDEETVKDEEIERIMEDYTRQLKNSGWERREARERMNDCLFF